MTRLTDAFAALSGPRAPSVPASPRQTARPAAPAAPRITPGQKAPPAGPNKPAALNAPYGVPYDAADMWGQHTRAWVPPLWSADTELNPWRDRIVSRVRDLVRNDGWAAGAVTRTLDNAMGVNFHPISKPDYRALAHMTGNPAFDAKWAREFGRAVDARWRTWANDPGRYNDSQRMLTFGQQANLSFRHLLVDGDALTTLPWMPERVSRGRAQYATTVQVIDPDRLSNPQMFMDMSRMRGGVELDYAEAPIAYHIRRAHQGDWYNAAKSVEWERIERESSWGRPQVVHMFEHHRADQHRGGAGMLAPVVQRLKMLTKYDCTELDSAIVNAIFAAYIESPYDHQMTAEALDSPTGGGFDGGRWAGQLAWNAGRDLSLQGARIPMLYPGEKINAVTAARPNSNYADFQAAVLNNVASGMGLAPMQVSNDWSKVNYSSARGALLEAWKTLKRRREEFAIGWAAPIRIAWMEEAMEVDDLPLPRGAPDYIDARAAYARCQWMGPGRGWIDPVSEKQGSILAMDGGLSTLEKECAENEGADWEENVHQRALEIETFKELGIPLPEWTGTETTENTERKPEAE
ncbi:phage portal protein [Komagataeibacter oboediens]|uniref:phage portal protein n=1 Tax=Komagataeibacter oboediens TaxID=65958 RepID=UPI001C2DEA8F|nr:phage portal protein [Komagataeibacter oboediens]MBV1823366.1 phage portal protein [Komagataeibacter oboediens]